MAFTAVTSCNNQNGNSNTKVNSSDSSINKKSDITKNDNSSSAENSSPAPDNNNSKNVVDNNKKETKAPAKYDYEVAVGSSFSIELASNPTTGYRWHWANRNSVSIVDTAGYSYTRSRPGMMGSGGKETWKFTGKKTGIDSIKFEYSRSWEKNPPIKSKAFFVKVD